MSQAPSQFSSSAPSHVLFPRRRTSTALAALGLALVLAGCGGGSDDAAGKPEEGSASAVAGYPVTVRNCGTEVTFDEPPQRVVTIKSTSTELLLALGLGERIVGQAFGDGPVPEQWAEEAAGIPTISDEAPSQEVVLEQEPDLVLAGWESNLAADTAGERDQLARLGVHTYVSPAACQAPQDQPDRMTFDLLFDQFQEVGRILGAPEPAAELVREQRSLLAEVSHARPGTTALWWSSGEDTPYVGGGIGAPQMVLDALGLDNVVGDVDQTWTSLGWEAIVDADPDVIVLVDATWNSARDKIDQLESSPATAELSAVRRQRYLVVPFPAAEAGVRSVPAAIDLSGQLGELGLLEPTQR
ncbi:putative F420-0 ABC transporter substrate-binding protein [Nocardioides houyundeii]|uniref:putative F420-0 ABC transporter substrate-binding protein n=1 Tax=Nocardioides houyundeii TaxID=2045452 RepID=UPI0019640F6E|nr:putative F420-0 ABC transporter substrate-binding protein [Nocardioides houyundeii]